MLKKLLTPKWILTTLLVMAAMAVMVRLGFWQLDRLAQRRAYNARVTAQLSEPPLDLNADSADPNLVNMEYRGVTVTGHYNFSEQVVLLNQVWQNQPGVHLLTPLVIDGAQQAVMVDRGWIPLADASSPQGWGKYDQPGSVTVQGMIRLEQTSAGIFGGRDPALAPGQTRLDQWILVNLDRIRHQVAEPLLPVYVVDAPDPAWQGMPYRSLPQITLTEGPHLSYAIQWFSFAALLGLGYPFFIRWQLRSTQRRAGEVQPGSHQA